MGWGIHLSDSPLSSAGANMGPIGLVGWGIPHRKKNVKICIYFLKPLVFSN